MKTHLKAKTLTKAIAAALLLSAANLAQADITITKADGSVCTSGTIFTNGTVTPVDSSCSAPSTPPSPTPPGACPPQPAGTVVFDTGSLNTNWPQQTFLAESQLTMSYKVTVPSNFTGRSNFTATRHSQALRAKTLVVSTCPGVLTPVGGQRACTKENATDSAAVKLSTVSSDASFYCKLTPGVYYVNAVSKSFLSDSGFNCTTTTNCAFFAGRGAPY